jgi:rubrerythrin
MSINDPKRELLEHLEEILKMEGKAGGAYTELAEGVNSPQLKSFLRDLAEEEKGHAKLVRGMMSLISGEPSSPFYEPPTD